MWNNVGNFSHCRYDGGILNCCGEYNSTSLLFCTTRDLKNVYSSCKEIKVCNIAIGCSITTNQLTGCCSFNSSDSCSKDIPVQLNGKPARRNPNGCNPANITGLSP